MRVCVIITMAFCVGEYFGLLGCFCCFLEFTPTIWQKFANIISLTYAFPFAESANNFLYEAKYQQYPKKE